MSDANVLDIYFREIGVKTPVSLLFCSHEIEENSDNAVNHDVETVKPITDFKSLKQHALVCQQCGLSSTTSSVQFGSGDQHADILLVADVPHVDQVDVLTDDANLLLNQMLKAVGLQREQVYITPMIQCATPDHRDPTTEEWAACQPWLQQKIDWMQPKVMLVMGRVAAQTLLQSEKTLHDLRGQWHRYQDVPTRVVYHPAYLLRAPRQKQAMWEDLQIVFQECLS